MKKTKLMLGDNIESLKKLPDNSVDSVVTDPPYGLSFMNKKWDYDVPSVEFWTEVYRVLKPGGHILSFGGTRTYHRMVVNIEDAGFEIRDQIQWIYGSGFPKSHNISKAISKINGEDVKIGKAFVVSGNLDNNIQANLLNGKEKDGDWKHIPTTEEAIKYEGWGTALKPANEPICVARKPLSEKSVAENVLKWGTGGINVDGCRVGYKDESDKKSLEAAASLNNKLKYGGNSMNESITMKELVINDEGRFPANIILECICDDSISHEDPNCPCRLLDEQSGTLKTGSGEIGKYHNSINDGSKVGMKSKFVSCYADKGGASRYFYQAKVSKAERNMGLDGFEDKEKIGNLSDVVSDSKLMVKNNHPTVKPINLMAYLCRLITPAGGIVLDPFMGSGSTGVAAQLEGFRFVGMEMDKDYFKIAEARIDSYEKYNKFHKGDQGLKNGNTTMASRKNNDGRYNWNKNNKDENDIF